MKRNIVITGGAGFIGSHVVRLFVNKYPEYNIINLDKLTYAGNLANLKDIEDKPNYKFVKMDICKIYRQIMTMRNHDKVRKLCMGLCFVLLSVPGMAQFTYGTTGLLHMPTAEMQRDKTVMLGGGYLNEQAMPSRWTYDTWNYYLNITFFPWLEVAYTCNVFDEMIKRGSAWIHMKNQDRSFHGRLRLWKEGWWKEWTPQIVAGVNDFTTGGSKDYTEMGVDGDGNGYFNRYYLAATKHFSWYGKWGVHAAYLYNRRNLDKLNGMAAGVHYEFDLPGTTLWQKALNGMKLMAEYDSKFVNVGARYACWKESINIIAEWRECQYPSVGVYFKLHLK